MDACDNYSMHCQPIVQNLCSDPLNAMWCSSGTPCSVMVCVQNDNIRQDWSKGSVVESLLNAEIPTQMWIEILKAQQVLRIQEQCTTVESHWGGICWCRWSLLDVGRAMVQWTDCGRHKRPGWWVAGCWIQRRRLQYITRNASHCQFLQVAS